MITAGYVVGCDGAHSRVRHELGLPFQGHPYPQDWLLADVRLDWARPEDEVHAFFRADGVPLVCFPMREHRWRLVVPFAGDRAPGAPDLAEIQRLVDQRAPERVVVSDPTWLASFNCHRRSTDVYRRGHVLLAGDAVHIHTPAGGQGMNTGITDAHNLGWKLALVAVGRAPGQLLDTYGREREPVAAQVLGLTHALVRFGTMTHPVQRALRDTIVPAASRVGPVHRRAVRRWTQVNVGYPASSLTWPDRGRGRPGPGSEPPTSRSTRRTGPAGSSPSCAAAVTSWSSPGRIRTAPLPAGPGALPGPVRGRYPRLRRCVRISRRPRRDCLPGPAGRIHRGPRKAGQAGDGAGLPAGAVRRNRDQPPRPAGGIRPARPCACYRPVMPGHRGS